MKKWLLKLLARRQVITKINVVDREEFKLTLMEWKSNPDLVKAAMRVWSNADFRLMVACLRNESPGYSVLPDDANPQRSVALQRRQEGYVMCIANLEAMREYQRSIEPLEPTFEPEEKVEL